MAQRSDFGWQSALPATTDKATHAYLLARDAIRWAKNVHGVVFAHRDLSPCRPARPVRGHGAGS